MPEKVTSSAEVPTQGLAEHVGRAGRWGIALWMLVVVVIHFAAAALCGNWLYQNKLYALRLSDAGFGKEFLAGGQTPAETTPPPGHEKDVPQQVSVGLYLDRIIEVSPKDSYWSADFYCWFRWKDATLEPGENVQVVNGAIESRTKLETNRFGEEFYALYRIQAKITKVFDITRYPCDDHLLVISLEDAAKQAHQLKYVSDDSSSVSSRAAVSGYSTASPYAVVRPHSYRTRRGHIDLPVNFKATYSQFNFALPIHRPGWGFFFKMFQGLFAAVAVALLAFLITPTHVDPRFGLGVGSFFAAIANQYVVSSFLPDTGVFALCDLINCLGLAAIFLTVLQSCASLYLYDTRGFQALSRRFDRCSLITLALVYVFTNIWLLAMGTRWP